MSSSLEYLPLFIFVLTLTYKKKKKKSNLKKKHPTTKRMFRCWRRNGPSAPLSHNVWGLGPGVAVAHRSSSWGAQGNVSRFPSYIWTQHARIMSSGTDSVLSWARTIEPLAPFKYYVTMVSNASSLAPKDTWRS